VSRILVLAILILLTAGPAAGQVSQVPEVMAKGDFIPMEADTAGLRTDNSDFILTDELFESLENEDCPTVEGYAFRALPYWIINDDSNSVFEFLYFWEVQCGASEPLQRMWILATIWQASFDESYYDEDITEFMIERYEEERESHTPLRQGFDDFTVDMADQMLPHQDRGSLEEFWCLFYSGRREEAWALLDGPGLKDSWLSHYRENEAARLNKKKYYTLAMFTGGGWWPSGDMEWVGDKPMLGGLVGFRARDWLVRLAVEIRMGRTDSPYFVPGETYLGRSNRFDATYIGGEFGRVVNLTDRQAFDLFFGIGVDGVIPFQGEDVSLLGWNANVGVGYRYFLGRYHDFVLGVDVRREWVGDRNEDPYSMSGRAWSLRVGVGYAFVRDRTRTLEGLGK
jgi:hypothetical protein